jgi:hypothetical protein
MRMDVIVYGWLIVAVAVSLLDMSRHDKVLIRVHQCTRSGRLEEAGEEAWKSKKYSASARTRNDHQP